MMAGLTQGRQRRCHEQWGVSPARQPGGPDQVTLAVSEMLFPDVSPSRNRVFVGLADALSGKSTRIYLDASLLIRSYEVSIAARDELLDALDKFDDRVAVPVWAARETWEYVRKRPPRRPLEAAANRIKKDLNIFRTAALRFVDDKTVEEMTKIEYQKQLDQALQAVTKLADRVAHHEPGSDVTTARLMPFIEGKRLNSDLTKILDVVERTGAARVAHSVPPGFADTGVPDNNTTEDRPARTKGKARNQFGDLINWLEALDDCLARESEQLVFITADVKKDDWVFVPDRIMDDQGRPQKNAGLVTLPLPLLVHEAHKTCPKLKGLHIVSLEMFAHVLQRYLRMPVPNLAAAIQALDEDEPSPARPTVVPAEAAVPDELDTPPTFASSDMNYGFQRGDDIDALLNLLNVEGWRAQNQAVRDIEPLIHRAVRDQLVQIGRGLAGAANDGALEPVELLRRIFADPAAKIGVRSNTLVGVLAQIYIADTGELQKPVSHPELTAFIYDHEKDQALAAAYAAVLERVEPQRKTYLGVPTDHADEIHLVFTLEGKRLSALSTNGHPLLEADAPQSRALRRLGPATTWSVAELVSELAREFVVPPAILLPDIPNTMRLQIPENTGYVRWGPNTGAPLR